MKSCLSLIVLAFILAGTSSCKNKRTTRCYLVEAGWDTVGFYKELGVFHNQAEKECEAEVEHRDTLEVYYGYFHDCSCSTSREN